MSEESILSFEAAQEWLFSLKNRGSTYGIERMRVLAEALGAPQSKYPVIHVAGTNGKGSTCSMLETIFRAHGFRTGLSTSPHLVRQGERIQVDRKILEESEILAYTRELRLVAAEIAKEDAELHPSFFEFMTAMALLQFARSEVDVAIVEVGLGGRLDATNVVDPEICVITSIGMDHCEILGNDLATIAREKGGIIKPGKPVVIGWLEAEAEAVIEEICAERGCTLCRVKDVFGDDLTDYPETSLNGGYQRINAGIATLVCRILEDRFQLKSSQVASSLKEVQWPGRWQEAQMRHRKIVFDVSHNAEGAKWLEEDLRKLADAEGAPDVVMGVMGSYRAAALVPVVCRYARSLRLVIPEQSRACTFEEMESLIPDTYSGEVIRTDVNELFPREGECVLDVTETAPLLVTGSIYLIGEVWGRYYQSVPTTDGKLQDF
tara:strand:+ start:216 stop:1520 length:1305 start_codon:yes stop_codon:yes gene_type:complete